MHFIQLPNNVVFLWIPRTGSTSIAKSILEQHYPERLNIPVSMSKNVETAWQRLLPKANSIKGQRIIALIRNPEDRFISACARTGLSIDEGLKSEDIHFCSVSKFARGYNVEWFSFPDRIDDALKALSLQGVKHLNKSIVKPAITSEQQEKIRERYKDDFAIFDSLHRARVKNVDELKYELKQNKIAALSNFAFKGKTIQTRDANDIGAINAAALTAMRDVDSVFDWICADNSILRLNAFDMIDMHSRMTSYRNEICRVAHLKTAAIDEGSLDVSVSIL